MVDSAAWEATCDALRHRVNALLESFREKFASAQQQIHLRFITCSEADKKIYYTSTMATKLEKCSKACDAALLALNKFRATCEVAFGRIGQRRVEFDAVRSQICRFASVLGDAGAASTSDLNADIQTFKLKEARLQKLKQLGKRLLIKEEAFKVVNISLVAETWQQNPASNR